MKVINIADARPQLAGPARCLECRAEWIGIAPLGMVVLDCPKCGAQKGARLAMILKEGPHWVCVCGNGLFAINEAGAYCPNCGLEGPGLKETTE